MENVLPIPHPTLWPPWLFVDTNPKAHLMPFKTDDQDADAEDTRIQISPLPICTLYGTWPPLLSLIPHCN